MAAQSHSSHRVVAFEPLAPAALFVRIALTFAAIRVRPVNPSEAGFRTEE